MKLPISRNAVRWIGVGILAVILVWGGATGRLGSVLGAIVAPSQMQVSPQAAQGGS